ncbi:MAG: ARPP-1 family domain-containing protein [Pyrinomonadaceae bacterium]
MTLIPGSRTLAATLCACALLLAVLALPSGPQAARAKGRPSEQELQVLAPVSYKNLTIFPIRGQDQQGSDAYITLDEGTKAGTVVITERSGGQSARILPHANAASAQRQNVVYSSGASVNELALVNRSGKKLLLLAGEVVVGGKQDRIVQEDRLIPPVSIPVALNVFCVEHGRWTPRTASYSSGGGGRSAARAEAPDDGKFSSLGAVAHPKLRAAAQDKKAQGEVWSEVSANNAKLGTANSTDTYQEVYKSGRVGAQMDDYLRALEREVLQPGVVGVVIARNGQPVWADVFASQRLFASYWPKLLKSYVVDALGDVRNEGRPTVAEASRYLRDREGTISTTTQEGIYQLVKTEQPSYAIFELRDTSLAVPLRVHWNKMDR